MRNTLIVILALGGSAISAHAADPCQGRSTPECQALAQARCKQASDQMLVMAQELPAVSSNEQKRKSALVAQIQNLLATNRRSGVDECRSWTEINRIAARQ